MADEMQYDDLIDGAVPSSEPSPAEPVAGANPEPTSAAAPASDPDLDALLAQFEQEAAQPPQPDWQQAFQGQQYQTQLAEQRAELAHYELQQVQQQRDLQDGLALVKELRGDLPIPDAAVGFWLDAALLQRPELQQIWQARHTNPEQFERAKHLLGRELHQVFKRLPDQEATETRALVAHAVLRSSEGGTFEVQEPPPDFGNMSDGELRDYTRKNFGFV